MIAPAQTITTAEKPVHFTAEQYFYLSQRDLLGMARTELINGEIIRMPSQYDTHAWAVSQLTDWLNSVFPKRRYWVRVQATLHCLENVPEPDFAVISERRKPGRSYMTGDRAMLVAEVADSTLLLDTRVKPAIYAAVRVPDYWVLDVQHRKLIVHRDPANTRSGPRYRSVVEYEEAARVAPMAIPKKTIRVSRLLP